MDKVNVKKAEGKLGVLVVGLGAVTTTFMTGVLMARKGLAKPVGSMTQYDKIRVGKGADKKYLKYDEIVPMTKLDDIVFGAWDAYPENAYESAINCEVLKEKDINPVKDELEKIVPMKAAFDKNFAKRLEGNNVKEGVTVKIEVSKGPSGFILEDYRGKKIDVVKLELESKGIKVVATSKNVSTEQEDYEDAFEGKILEGSSMNTSVFFPI